MKDGNLSRHYWKNRIQKYGHPGWKDPIVHAYDQQKRLEIVRAALRDYPKSDNNAIALDFGCGTGDFSRLLLAFGFSVYAYDPFVRPNIQDTQCTYSASLESETWKNLSAQLALSITVLDHIVDDEECQIALKRIRNCLQPGGVFFMMEYSLDFELDRIKISADRTIMSLRTLAQWQRLLEAASFRIQSVQPVFHPILNPSLGYKQFRENVFVKYSAYIWRLPLSAYWFPVLLKKIAHKIIIRNKETAVSSSGSSPLKLITCIAERPTL